MISFQLVFNKYVINLNTYEFRESIISRRDLLDYANVHWVWIADCLESDKCDGYADDKYICYHGKQLDPNHKVYSLHTLYT